MKIPNALSVRLWRRLREVAGSRPPDFVIGDNYLRRWYLARSNDNVRFGGAYLHQIIGDDDDRALHDHPWVNVSIILSGAYLEHGPGRKVTRRSAGDVVARRPTSLHRLEVDLGPVWTLFLFGPKVRVWGFACPQGWVPWYDFVDPENPGKSGKGCG